VRRSQKLGFEAPDDAAAGFAMGVADDEAAGLRADFLTDFLAVFFAGRFLAALRLAGLRAAAFLAVRFFAGALLAVLRFEVVRFAALRLAGLRAAAFLVVRRFAGMRIPLFHAPNGAEQG